MSKADDFKRLREAIAGKTPGPWAYTTCYGVATIKAKDGESIAHAVEYLETCDAAFIAILGTVAPELMAVVDAADSIRYQKEIDDARLVSALEFNNLIKALIALKAALREGE